MCLRPRTKKTQYLILLRTGDAKEKIQYSFFDKIKVKIYKYKTSGQRGIRHPKALVIMAQVDVKIETNICICEAVG